MGPFLSRKFPYIGWNNIFEVEIWQKFTNKKINACVFILHLCSFHIDYLQSLPCFLFVHLFSYHRMLVTSLSCMFVEVHGGIFENSMRILSPHMELRCHLSTCEVVNLVFYAPKARTRNFKNGIYFPQPISHFEMWLAHYICHSCGSTN